VKRFRFRLERLLELRVHREREALNRLAEATGHCVRLARGLRQAEESGREALRAQRAGLGLVDMELLAYREHYLAWLKERRRRLARELAERQKKRQEEQARYLEASKERKVLDKLKERRAAEHHREARTEEFEVADDLSSSRFTGRPGEE
jgi:flagellar FliJ protein